jgi:hypothetical protein
MTQISTNHKVAHISEDSINYLALALRARLQDLITAMIHASHHRTEAQFDRPPSFYENGNGPMWGVVVKSDVRKQLAALEAAEREEEMKVRRERRERKEAAEAQAAALAAQAAGNSSANSSNPASGRGDNAMAVDGEDGEGSAAEKPKKKRKKDGPGVTARNMSEDVRKKMSNAAASHAAGLGGKYAWMNAANLSSGPPPKGKKEKEKEKEGGAAASSSSPVPPAAAAPTLPSTTPAVAVAAGAKPYEKTPLKTEVTPTVEEEPTEQTVVTMRDAIFVIEKERGHGGGRGSARGWT